MVELGRQLPHSREQGPVGDALRRPRDAFFLALLVVFWVGMVTLAIRGGNDGDPKRLIRLVDSRGNLCGVDNTDTKSLVVKFDYRHRKRLWFSDPSTSLESFCVNACPDGSTTSENITGLMNPNDTPKEFMLNFVSGKNVPTQEDFYWCIPSEDVPITRVGTRLPNSQNTFNRTIGDLWLSWAQQLILACISVVVSLFFLLFYRILPRVVTFVHFGMLVVATIALAVLIIENGFHLRSVSEDKEVEINARYAHGTWLLVLGFLLACAALFFFALVLRQLLQIHRCSILFEEGFRALSAVPRLYIVPVVLCGVLCALIVYWIVVALYVVSSGELKQSNDAETTEDMQYNYFAVVRQMLAFHFIGLFWTTAWLVAINNTIVGGAVATWFFGREQLEKPVQRAALRTMKFHLGSLAFGSLIISFIRVIRMPIRFVAGRTKDSPSRVAHVLCCCAQCSWAFFERFLEFVSEYAYVEIAIRGKGLCAASVHSFQVLRRNADAVGTTHILVDFSILLCKFAVVSIVGMTAWAMLRRDSDILNPLFPALIAMVLSWGIASVILGLVQTATHTILLCYCEDLERNDGTVERPYFSGEDLRRLVKTALSHEGLISGDSDTEQRMEMVRC